MMVTQWHQNSKDGQRDRDGSGKRRSIGSLREMRRMWSMMLLFLTGSFFNQADCFNFPIAAPHFVEDDRMPACFTRFRRNKILPGPLSQPEFTDEIDHRRIIFAEG